MGPEEARRNRIGVWTPGSPRSSAEVWPQTLESTAYRVSSSAISCSKPILQELVKLHVWRGKTFCRIWMLPQAAREGAVTFQRGGCAAARHICVLSHIPQDGVWPSRRWLRGLPSQQQCYREECLCWCIFYGKSWGGIENLSFGLRFFILVP